MLHRTALCLAILFLVGLSLHLFGVMVSNGFSLPPVDVIEQVSDGGSLSKEPLSSKPEIETSEDAQQAAGTLLKAAKAGNWWLFSSILIMLVMFVLKKIGILVKMGRLKYIALPILGILSSLLAVFQGGASIDAVIAVMASALATGKLQEIWEHGILGVEHSTKKE